MHAELLFSYGTLQLGHIQQSTFGRLLEGTVDALPKFTEAPLPIDDPEIAAALGKTHYAIAQYTGRDEDSIPGTVYALTTEELQLADVYELPEYQRVAVVLASGIRCWVYADVAHLPPHS